MASQEQLKEHPNIKKVVSLESFIFMAGFAVMFGVLGTKMGAINMLNTMMQTAYQLLMDTVFYIMAVSYTHLDVYKRQLLSWPAWRKSTTSE